MNNKFWKSKITIVTGANGFVASHITINLLTQGAKVIGVIKEYIPGSYLEQYVKSNRPKNLKLVKGDISDYLFIKRLFIKNEPDFCFHVAAQAIVGIANKTPIPTFKTNIEGTWNILDAVREFSPSTAVVVASSDKAYGEHKKLPYTEEASLQAMHPYDASKACTDILARTYAHTYGLPVAVTRCANIYGPGDLNFSRIIPDTIRSAILDKNPIIRSDGTPLRDYIFIGDIVRAYLMLAMNLALHKPEISGEAFNFGSGKPISVLGLVELILDVAAKTGLRPVILSKRKIKGEIDKQYLSSAKAKRLLGWSCKNSLRQGLAKTLEWYREYVFSCLK
ncbi:MAG: GDP-mannose 4,6-dehydratase [Candidatus Omnitrophica bacterium]|nr:GDP-mannose 4,6-dehydratase [Candidatus Omnitrophota bacterium]